MTSSKKFFFISLVLNLLILAPAFAQDLSDDDTARDDKQVFHLSDKINLISQQKVQYDKPRVVVRAVYPELQTPNETRPSDEDTDENLSIKDFNDRVGDFINQEIDQFKNKISDERDYQKTLARKKVKNDLTIDYNASTIKSGDHLILSIRFSVQGYITGIEHPYHHHRVLNYDLGDFRSLELSDLFDKDSDYLSVMSEYSRKQLLRKLSNKEMIKEGTRPTEENFKNWNIKSNGLLITFDEYQVAAYAFGPQIVRIPFSLLKDMVPKDSPIAKCAIKKRCGSNNILTGGFIDQA